MIDAAAHASDGIAHLRLRVGVHSGPVIGGVIGHRKLAFDIWGETVNIASRLGIARPARPRHRQRRDLAKRRAFSTRNIAVRCTFADTVRWTRTRSSGAAAGASRAPPLRDRFDRTSGARGVRGAPGAHQSPEGIGKGATTEAPDHYPTPGRITNRNVIGRDMPHIRTRHSLRREPSLRGRRSLRACHLPGGTSRANYSRPRHRQVRWRPGRFAGGLEHGSAYWQAGWDWFAEQRKHLVRP